MEECISLDDVRAAYERAGGELDNEGLYAALGLPPAGKRKRAPVGRTGQRHSLQARAIRWHQQTLKRAGILQRKKGQRGHWAMTPEAMGEDRTATAGVALVAFSTRLGVASWAHWEDVFPKLDAPIALLVSSPPYPLRKMRAYGNPHADEYVDFITRALEPIVRNLVDGGVITLNVGNDIFEPGSPARSLYREKMVIALHERLGLSKFDELIWANFSKPPGPVRWASITRQHLNCSFEPVYVLTNNPLKCRADNRHVLESHTERHRRLIAKGGEQRNSINCDGAYRIREGSYKNDTAGRIPRNVLMYGHACKVQQAVKSAARARGLAPHGAPMPLALADFLVRYLSAPGDLVVDPFGGSLTTGHAAEMNGRRWICTERQWDYLAAGAHRFS